MKVLIIDGYNMLHRARVVKNLGQYGVAFNFLRMLRSAVDSVRPDVAYFVVEGDPQWRKQLMGEYKANRVIGEDDPRFEEMVDFQTQKRICIELIRRHKAHHALTQGISVVPLKAAAFDAALDGFVDAAFYFRTA